MDSQDILERARKNKNRGKEYENAEYLKNSILGACCAVVMGLILFAVEYFVKGTVNFSFIAVLYTAWGMQTLLNGVKNKKTGVIVLGALELLFAIFIALGMIGLMVSK